MALDCFFAVWFVVGNVWIFGGNASAPDAPNLCKLCIVFLTISCTGYAMPFILCAIICCCLSCIISILRVRKDVNQMERASIHHLMIKRMLKEMDNFDKERNKLLKELEERRAELKTQHYEEDVKLEKEFSEKFARREVQPYQLDEER